VRKIEQIRLISQGSVRFHSHVRVQVSVPRSGMMAGAGRSERKKQKEKRKGALLGRAALSAGRCGALRCARACVAAGRLGRIRPSSVRGRSHFFFLKTVFPFSCFDFRPLK
jgi:hypothetical protein